jgi:glycosyltransferase involved in cell wall biosynthesis
MAKLNVVIMGQNCEKFLPMCLESVKNADNIIYCDGGSENDMQDFILNLDFIKSGQMEFIRNEYDQDDKSMNGKQRNFYLDYLKENHMSEWALCLDADEVVEDLDRIKEFINTIQSEAEDILFSPKMRHFHGDLGREDATQKEHFVLNRLFKVRDDLIYPEVEHPVLTTQKEEMRAANLFVTTIWHLAHIQHCFEIKKRYDKNIKHSNIHSKEFLDNWYKAHLFNRYPTSNVNPLDVPKVILDNFGIDKDEFYFANRGVEPKHFIMTRQWSKYWKVERRCINEEYIPEVIEFGCGLAPFGVGFVNQGWKYTGIELSKFAVDHAFIPINKGDIIKDKLDGLRDLCVCFDVLEHLTKEELDKALDNIKDCASDFIFSVPVIGDPNLETDKTHKIKEDKGWWITKLSEYFTIRETPKDWLYSHQIIIGERK